MVTRKQDRLWFNYDHSPLADEVRPWHYVIAPDYRKHSYVGKWMIFRDRAKVEAVWRLIAEATIAGRLGMASKVATAYPTVYTSKLICVYTKDHRNYEDVMRVRAELRRMGFEEVLHYKTDAETIAGGHETKYRSM